MDLTQNLSLSYYLSLSSTTVTREYWKHLIRNKPFSYDTERFDGSTDVCTSVRSGVPVLKEPQPWTDPVLVLDCWVPTPLPFSRSLTWWLRVSFVDGVTKSSFLVIWAVILDCKWLPSDTRSVIEFTVFNYCTSFVCVYVFVRSVILTQFYVNAESNAFF